MKHWKRITTILALLVLAIGGGVIGVIIDHFVQSPAALYVIPADPSQTVFDNGKITVTINSARQYGYRIGDSIPITVTITSDPGILIDTESIEHLAGMPPTSDLELASKPVVTVSQNELGKPVRSIAMVLRSWGTTPTINLSASLRYASDKLPNGQPNWTSTRLDDYTFSTTNTTTESSQKIRDGDLQRKSVDKTDLILPMQLAGGLLLLVPLVFTGRRLCRRLSSTN